MKKQQLQQKFKELVKDLNTNELPVIVSTDTLALMCATIEYDMLQTCHYQPTNITANYIIQNVINGLRGDK